MCQRRNDDNKHFFQLLWISVGNNNKYVFRFKHITEDMQFDDVTDIQRFYKVINFNKKNKTINKTHKNTKHTEVSLAYFKVRFE